MWARDRSRCCWWAGRESNPHSRRRLVYSQRSSPPAQPTHCGDGTSMRLRSQVTPATGSIRSGADDGTRTRNLLFTKQLLYQLSYVGATRRVIPQMTPSAPGNDRAARSDGSSAGSAGLPRRGPLDRRRGLGDGGSARQQVGSRTRPDAACSPAAAASARAVSSGVSGTSVERLGRRGRRRPSRARRSGRSGRSRPGGGRTPSSRAGRRVAAGRLVPLPVCRPDRAARPPRRAARNPRPRR